MDSTGVRRRNVGQKLDEVLNNNSSVRIVTNFDAFPKVPTDLQRQTTSGATLTVFAFLCIAILIISEMFYYSSTFLQFDYEVDPDFTSRVPINVDLVVAMPCATIGADVLDITGQNTLLFGQLEEEDVRFEMSAEEQQYWNMFQHVNSYMKTEYHAIHDLLWRSDHMPQQYLLKRSKHVSGKTDACRLHGTLHVNKLAGNFHVTAGRTFPHPAGHAHISAFLGPEDYNFSHRITEFSFGSRVAGIVNPLDGDEKTSPANLYMYQYLIKVIPTDVSKRWARTLHTHQYSVTEQERTINHANGSHGNPGIYFRYDFFPFKVKVSEQHYPYWQFLVRLCGIVGGVFTTLGILNSLVCCVVERYTGSSASTIKDKFSNGPRQVGGGGSGQVGGGGGSGQVGGGSGQVGGGGSGQVGGGGGSGQVGGGGSGQVGGAGSGQVGGGSSGQVMLPPLPDTYNNTQQYNTATTTSTVTLGHQPASTVTLGHQPASTVTLGHQGTSTGYQPASTEGVEYQGASTEGVENNANT